MTYATDELHKRFAAQRSAFDGERDPSLAVRLDRLRRLDALTANHEAQIVAAIAADFGTRCSQETRMAELFMVSAGIRHARRHLARWTAPRRLVRSRTDTMSARASCSRGAVRRAKGSSGASPRYRRCCR